ncbi:MAG: DUF116 domain-containing protein [Candidatus Bathyarchaeota archaeon]|nr:DUF116 domain-containing protein [Candidatus Bathyarchaeota archaeon]
MPYKFNFDLTKVSSKLFREMVRVAYEKKAHKRISRVARNLIKKLKIDQITGLQFSEALLLVEDLVDVYLLNATQKEKFERTSKRVLFLPHCARKYMDGRCKSIFKPEVPTYICQRCSLDCLVNQTSSYAQKMGYDVYIVAGGSCIPQILRKNRYEGVVGVACSEELKLAASYVKTFNIPGQAVPLIKNGCSETKFNMEELLETLKMGK